MQLIVNKTTSLNGKACMPGSKSQSIRGIFFALLTNGTSTISNFLDADDTQTAIQVCKSFGAELSLANNVLTLTTQGLPFTTVTNKIYTGNSGITTRFILPLLGLRANYNEPVLVTCGEQMQARPIQSLLDALCALGMNISYVEKAGRLPALVSGQLMGGTAEVSGTTSQFLSALLISLPCAPNDSVITVQNLNERPYIEITLAWLKMLGIQYKHQQSDTSDVFYIKGGQTYSAFNTTIAGDFSSASCVLAAATLLPGSVELHGLDLQDTQGDKQLIPILQAMGADLIIENNIVKINGGKVLHGMPIDANAIPDLLPALAVIATQAKGKTEIYNVAQARLKETDRIHSMTAGLVKMGAKIEEHSDGMTIYHSQLQGNLVHGYDDHRTVMAFTVAGMVADGKTVVTNADAITKTYPRFVETMQTLGAAMENFQPTSNHIILIGFKHVGKTLIGQHLAASLDKKFIDLDHELEKFYATQHSKILTCRQIMQLHGEAYYRAQENLVLQQIIDSPSAVIALGGGAILDPQNQATLKNHTILHVIAPPGVVFERIMVTGRPAFFDPNEDPYASFKRLWETRSVIYKQLATYTINNNTSIDNAVDQARKCLQQGINEYA